MPPLLMDLHASLEEQADLYLLLPEVVAVGLGGRHQGAAFPYPFRTPPAEAFRQVCATDPPTGRANVQAGTIPEPEPAAGVKMVASVLRILSPLPTELKMPG